MKVSAVKFQNFRNFYELTAEFHPGINVFLGNNGQGKTNIMEALFLGTQGSLFRPGNVEQWVQKGAETARVNIKLIKNNLKNEIVIMGHKGRKTMTVNGKNRSSSFFKKNFSAVLFSPESLSAVKNGPDERRQLVDSLLVSLYPETAKELQAYSKALRSRNRLLRDYKQGLCEWDETARLLESLNEQFLLLAVNLTERRLESLEQIEPKLSQSFSWITKDSMEKLQVDYLISSQSARQWPRKKIEESLATRSRELFKAEMDAGVSLIGPHKHDIRFIFANEDARYYCSQGQQRAIILSFKMAQIQHYKKLWGHYPMLLLDDVLSELDNNKRANLIEYLRSVEAQIFITTTDFLTPQEFGEGISVFKINNGTLTYNQSTLLI